MTESATAEPVIPSADTRAGQAYLLFAISLLLVVAFGSVLQLRSFHFGLAVTELALILAPAVLFVRWKRLPLAEALRWRPVSLPTALLSVAVGVTSWGVAAGIAVLSEPLLGEFPPIPAFEPRTLSDLLWLLLVGALLPGFCEETLFRGVLQGVFSRKGQLRGVLITAALFGLYHVNPWNLVPAFLLGVVFGALVLRTGSTLPAILAHMATNATVFTLNYIYRDRPDSEAYPLVGGLALACCVTFAIFWHRTRGTAADPSSLATVRAAVSRPWAWAFGLLGGSVVALVVAGVAAAILLIDIHTVSDDTLEPDIHPGDKLILFRSDMALVDVEAGDIVSYRRDGELVFQRVVRMDNGSIWVGEEDKETRLSRGEIIGTVLHTIRSAGRRSQNQTHSESAARHSRNQKRFCPPITQIFTDEERDKNIAA